jgi:hypothetical protein
VVPHHDLGLGKNPSQQKKAGHGGVPLQS